MKIPKVYIKTKIVKKFKINSCGITRFGSNINGMTIEHLINTMLNVNRIDSFDFKLNNKKNLKHIGRLPSIIDEVKVKFELDGTVSAINRKNEKFVNQINKSTEQIKKQITPMIEYIKSTIFKNKTINSQELVVNKIDNVFSNCDLSNDFAVLEIKTTNKFDYEKIKLQLYYESNNRPVYVLNFDWNSYEFIISRVEFISEIEYLESQKKQKNQEMIKKIQNKIFNKNIEVLEYVDSFSVVKLQCKTCESKWTSSLRKILKKPICPVCHPSKKVNEVEMELLRKEKENNNYGNKYSDKINLKSNGKITILKYYGYKSNAKVGCLTCGHIWKIRIDRLLEKCYCPNCKNSKVNS